MKRVIQGLMDLIDYFVVLIPCWSMGVLFLVMAAMRFNGNTAVFYSGWALGLVGLALLVVLIGAMIDNHRLAESVKRCNFS